MPPDFGPLSATSDHDILSYFFVTPQARGIAEFGMPAPAPIMVARQGTGKSALTIWLRSEKATRITLSMSPDTHRVNTSDESLTTSDLEYLIRTELLIDVCLRAKEELDNRVSLAKRIAALCQNDWWDVTLDQLAKVRGGSLFGFGLQIEPAKRAQYLEKLRRKFGGINDGPLTELATEVAKAKHVLLVIDNPEDIVGQGIDLISDLNAQRVGSLLWALADVHHVGVRVACFVKEQTYQHVRTNFANFQQFSDLVGGLNWADEDLIELVDLRVRHRLGLTWADVFAEEPAAIADQVFPHLSNGPRDLIRLLNLAWNAVPMSSSDILEGVVTLQHERLEDLQGQYKQWPSLGTIAKEVIAEVFSADSDGRFSRGDLNQVFRNLYNRPGSETERLRGQVTWLAHVASGQPSMEQLLFSVGLLGYIGRDDAPRQPWNNRNSDEFATAKEYFVGALYRPTP